MKAIVRAVTKQKRLLPVREEVVDVAQLVVHRDEIVRRAMEAYFQADVLVEIDLPGAGVANDIAVGGAGQHRALPESVRQRLQSERLEKAFAELHNLLRRGLALLQNFANVVSGRRRGRGDQIIDV